MSADTIIATERNVLSVLFCDKETASLVLSLIKAGDVFTNASHRLVFNACKSLYDNDIDIDHQSVVQALSGDDKKDARFAAIEIAAMLASPSGARFYCESLLNAHALRKIGGLAKDVLKRSADQIESAEELISDFERGVLSVRDHVATSSNIADMDNILRSTFEQIETYTENASTGGISGVTTGFSGINEITCGFQPSDLIILAARPSMGKTALATNIVRNIARNGTCLFFSLEMSKVQLGLRFVSGESGVSAQAIRKGRVTQTDFTMLVSATKRLGEMKILVDDRGGITPDQIVETIRQVITNNSVSLVAIDYLQLIGRPGTRNTAEEIGFVTAELKNAAKRFNIPILLLSQLNRDLESRGGDRRPQLSDLRGSGSIEQDADVVAFLYRPEVYFPDPSLAGKAEFIVAKQRSGPTGTVPLLFDGKTMNFRDFAGDFDSQANEPPPF